MNCFQHANEVAVTTCKSCGKPLCAACSVQVFGSQIGVCSDVCARTNEAYPDPDDLPDTPSNRAFATIYLTVLAVLVGGGLGGCICAFGAQWNIESLKHPPLPPVYYSHHYHDPRFSIFRIFHDLGITNWPAEFGIGAAVGIGLAMLWVKQGAKIASAAGGAWRWLCNCGRCGRDYKSKVQFRPAPRAGSQPSTTNPQRCLSGSLKGGVV